MTWDNTPWFVQGGEHTAEVARLVAYAATGGKDGVVTPAALKVHQSAIADQNVVLDPGAVAVVNRKPNATGQSYLARKSAAENVPMNPTGGSARTDLIVAMIEDPQYPPTPAGTVQFVQTRVIEGVPANTRRLQDVAGYENAAGYAVARVTRPASTGTVTNAHITDLRRLAQARSHRELRTLGLATGQSEVQTSETAGGEQWPNAAGWDVNIPEWATRVKVVATWNGVRVPTGNVIGRISARLGLVALANAPVTQEVVYDTPGSSSVARETWGVADDLAIPAALRGTTVYAHLRARIVTKSSDAARVSVDGGSSVVLDLQFVEEVE